MAAERVLLLSAVVLVGARAWDFPASHFAKEWSAAMAFHAPGFDWAAGSMTMSTVPVHGDEPFLRFRFRRSRSMPWVTSDYTETFDDLLNASLRTEEYSMSFAEGAFCHGGFNEAEMLVGLKPTGETRSSADGQSCSILAAVAKTGNMSLCVAHDGVPREMNITMDGAVVGSSNVDQYHVRATFFNISVGPLPSDAFALPAACSEGAAPAACPHDLAAPLETVIATRWNHEAGRNCGLNNKMTNDLLGMLAFSPLEDAGRYWAYLQVYNVSVSRAFAPMQDCNYDPMQRQDLCTGGSRNAANAKNVGRSSSQYMTGPHGGQCTENALVGSWYQFPSEGQCAEGWDVGFAGCTWKTNSFRLIASECVVARCSEEAKRDEAPYPRAIACLKSAIAECPDLQGPKSSTCYSRPPVLI